MKTFKEFIDEQTVGHSGAGQYNLDAASAEKASNIAATATSHAAMKNKATNHRGAASAHMAALTLHSKAAETARNMGNEDQAAKHIVKASEHSQANSDHTKRANS